MKRKTARKAHVRVSRGETVLSTPVDPAKAALTVHKWTGNAHAAMAVFRAAGGMKQA